MKNAKATVFFLILAVSLSLVGCDKHGMLSIDKNSATATVNWKTPKLQCETHLETTWGDEAGQWGYSDDTARRFSLLPVVFKSEDEFYYLDFANLRLLKYSGTTKTPGQSINLAPLFPEGYAYSWQTMFIPPPASLISIYEDKIYVPYGGNQIAVLSFDGSVIDNILIPGYYYEYNFPTMDHAWLDEEGNLHIFWRVSFMAGWENLDWVKMSGTPLRHYSWHEYRAVQNGVSLNGSTITVYKKDISGSLIPELVIPVNITSNANTIYFPMFGVDNHGHLYLNELSDNPVERFYVRYSLLTGEKQTASMPYPYLGKYTSLYSSVSPDGIIYFVAYNNDDLTIAPAIIKCEFPLVVGP